MLLSVLVIAPMLASASPAMAAAVLEPSPSPLEFGAVEVHAGGFPQQGVAFSNGSVSGTTVESVAITGPNASEYSVAQDGCSGKTVEPTFSCDIEVRLQPQSPGLKSATLELVEASGTVEVQLSGTGTTGTLSANPLSFPLVRVGENQTEQIAINNAGAGTHVSNVEITGSDASSFSVAYGNCPGNTLPQGTNCSVGVRFAPSSAGAKTAQLVITSDAGNDPLIVPLSGTGANGPVLNVTPRQALLGNVLIGASAAQTFTITNTGDYPLAIQGAFVVSGTPLMFPIASETCSSQQIEPGDSCAFTVEFTPTTTGPKTASVILITNSSGGVSAVGLEGTGVDGIAPAVPGGSAPSALAGSLTPVAVPQLVSFPGHRPSRAVNTGITAICPAAVALCTVRSRLTASVPRHHRPRSTRRMRVPVGSTTLTLRGGQTVLVYGQLSSSGAALVKQRHKLNLSATVVITTPGAPQVTRSRMMTITAPEASPGRQRRG